MADSITALEPLPATVAANPTTVVDPTSTTNVPAASPALPTGVEDVVSFSIPAQVFLLAQQGAEVRQIASKLDVSSEEVMNDLDLVVAAVASITSPAAAAK